MKKYIYIWFLFFFSLNIFSDNEILKNDLILEEDLTEFNEVDSCTKILTSMESLSGTTSNKLESLDIPTLSFDIDLNQKRKNFNLHQYKRSENNNLYVNFFSSNIQTLKAMKIIEVNQINGIKVASMTDLQVDEALQNPDKNGNITFSAIRPETGKILSIEMPAYKRSAQLFLDLQIKDIESIDSAKGIYKTRYSLNVEYMLYSARRSLEKHFKDWVEAKGGKDLTWNISCNFSEDVFLNTGIWTPALEANNMISSEDYSKVSYHLYAEYVYPEITRLELTQMGDYVATFSAPFNFATFPFDRQDIIFNFGEKVSAAQIYINRSANTNTLQELNLYEWEIISFDAEMYIDPYSLYFDDQAASYTLSIERNSLYFLTKILIPIFIIIALTYSVMWINTKELESRLTVSVVCFLALITYTFIIDKDLPKLSYLTIMDYIILISYIFAAIPTIQSIYASRHRVYEKALIIDRRSRILLPAAYVILILMIIIFTVSSNPANTKAFLR